MEVEGFILYTGWLTIPILERAFDLQQTFTTTAARNGTIWVAARNGCLVHTQSPAGLTLKVACLTAIMLAYASHVSCSCSIPHLMAGTSLLEPEYCMIVLPKELGNVFSRHLATRLNTDAVILPTLCSNHNGVLA